MEETNKKIQYKNQKLKSAKTIYYCECGKDYLSFSALYLHAKSKHHIKLTTKLSPSICHIQKDQDCQKITFFMKERGYPEFQHQMNDNFNGQFAQKRISCQNTELKNDQQMLIENQLGQHTIERVISRYINENQEQKNYAIDRKFLMINFTEFIDKINFQENGIVKYCEQYSSEQIPYYFNMFIVNYLPNKFGTNYYKNTKKDMCEQLVKLGNWLIQNNYTSLETQYSPYWTI